ncbi:tRNA threonylcarbamoyladenosine biosynthesis protein TsaB [Campylobacter canadensis]|uniref:tRNA threonylcarbamoyladenosine biosynthesis protein TsaB n=1 Tax=Campylobacter canadensis TaxID=449520 RepID=UPI0015577790|nr:tRNA threonylcarbamoyladenosine biosynthesis protein TsaB [Campylobacter canadensis]MBZ7994460.1 tRNA threonylcarbamoyladenosine biosynthesis protein TsaB [Campylobacter canadensis]MBZ7996453.1 tRNA threonylcarbamoyladenosine biosynthesis protein TsaB [Campylobacter canadensis]MBZ7999825.1 tRNA threonylcarbamoyladenosine biosynthesis protein TsaB [Campylobacter canadensis]
MAVPAKIGIYDKDLKLVKSYELNNYVSVELSLVVDEILKEFKIDELIYANGPGSFMSLKIAYVFFSTLSLVLNIPLKATSAFAFSEQKLIKANNNFCFALDEDEKIILKAVSDYKCDLQLPVKLQINYESDNLPNYFIPAV